MLDHLNLVKEDFNLKKKKETKKPKPKTTNTAKNE